MTQSIQKQQSGSISKVKDMTSNGSIKESKGMFKDSKDNESNDRSSMFFSDKTPKFQSINQLLSNGHGFGFDKSSVTKGSILQL